MSHHRPIEFCVWCGEPIPTIRQSMDPPEFFCQPKCEIKFRLSSGLGASLDMAWPESGKPYNPSLVLVRAGRKEIPGDRVFRRVSLVPRRIDADLWGFDKKDIAKF